jgi:hypothetical protein
VKKRRRSLSQRMWVARLHGELLEQFDPSSLLETRQREQYRDGWAAWLGARRWDWWACATWRREPRDEIAASGDVELWVRKLRWIPGAAELAAAASIERGSVTGRLHAHVLLYTGGKLDAEWVRDEWWRWGQMHVEAFRPYRVRRTGRHGGAVTYGVKAPENVELHGLPPAYVPRRRRG